MFQLVELSPDGKPMPFTGNDGKPKVYERGKDAAGAATKYSKILGKRIQPRHVSDENWRSREQERFASGIYKPVPWADAPWAAKLADHFAHLSTERDGMVAFTANAADGVADKQTRQKPGKYLTAYASEHVTTEEIRAIATKMTPLNFLLAYTAEDIKRVYTNGPNSCMSGTAGRYCNGLSRHHPSEVYAGPDLAVAYTQRKDGRISSRALVWPERKLFGRIYGDCDRLEDALCQAGWHDAYNNHCHGTFDGARLAKIPLIPPPKPWTRAYVMPYLDVVGQFREEPEWFVLDRLNGTRGGGNTSGWVGVSMQCERCQSELHGDGHTVYTSFSRYGDNKHQRWCRDCRDDHAFRCPMMRQWVVDADQYRMPPLDRWPNDHYWRFYDYRCFAGMAVSASWIVYDCGADLLAWANENGGEMVS